MLTVKKHFRTKQKLFFSQSVKRKKKSVIFGCGRGEHVKMQHFNWDKDFNLLRTEWWNVTGASGASQHVLWCLQILHEQSTDTQQTVADVSPFPDCNSKSSGRKKEETKIDKTKISTWRERGKKTTIQYNSLTWLFSTTMETHAKKRGETILSF